MRNSLLCLAAAGLLFSACQQNNSTHKTTAGTAADSAVSDGHTAQNSLDWASTYEGVLPCADCEGIKTTLTLKEDLTYLLREEYLKKDVVNEEQGSFNWNKEGTSITVNRQDGGFLIFFVGENQLRSLDQAGKEITGPLASSYILKQQP